LLSLDLPLSALVVANGLTDRPSTEHRKPVSTLPPQMRPMLIWPVFANVARALFSNSLVIGEHAQHSLVRPLVHASRLDRYGTVRAPLEPCAQFLYPTSRAIPRVTHGGLIGYASALAAEEKPDVMIRWSIEHREHALNGHIHCIRT
jgi:hypothetical protein